MNLFPAILIGGPPHSGKSVLVHSLSKQLRTRNIPHYALRAAPDGEGDWSNEADWPVVERIRRKGQWTSRWVDDVCNAIGHRHLPLLVDMGGRPTPQQEAIFDQCNYAILLTPTAEDRAQWQARAQAHSLAVLADLHSDLDGQNVLTQPHRPLTGTLAGLRRGSLASGPAFAALVDQVAGIMNFTEADLWQSHRASAPWNGDPCVLNFDELPKTGRDGHGTPQFTGADIQRILHAIPDGRPVCLYGRTPATMIAAIAFRHPILWQFDARLGWVAPPTLHLSTHAAASTGSSPVAIQIEHAPAPERPKRIVLRVAILVPPIDLASARQIVLPQLPLDSEVVIDGILPYWLLGAIAHAYRACASVTVYQPRTSKPIGR